LILVTHFAAEPRVDTAGALTPVNAEPSVFSFDPELVT
jgi:hypothetical protein